MSELIKGQRHSHLQNNNPSNLIMDSNADEGNKSGIVSSIEEIAKLPDGYSQIFRSYVFGP